MNVKLNHKINSSPSLKSLKKNKGLLSTFFVLSLGVVGCTKSETQKKIGLDKDARPKSIEVVSNANLISKKVEKLREKTPEKRTSLASEGPENILLQALAQADQIHREVLGVLLKNKFPLQKSFFGKALRALRQNKKLGLQGKSAFLCDNYSLSKTKAGLGDYPFQLDLFHQCPGKSAMEKFAEVSMVSPQNFNARFESRYLEEVVGLASSILNRAFNCEFKVNKMGFLEDMKCDLVLQEKSVEEVYEFSKYEYSSGKNSIVILEGKLLKNLLPQRSVRFTVPLEGKIKVQEKELLPLDSVVEESPISPEQTIDPDLLKSRRQKKIISVAPVKLHPQSGAEGPWIDEEGYPLTPEQIQEMKTRFKENQQEESHGQSFSKEPNIRDQEDQQEDQSKIQQENFSLPIEQRNENEKSRPQENGELSNFER